MAPEPKQREREHVSVSLSRWHWSAVPYSVGTLKWITDSNDQHPHLLSHVPCLCIRASRCLLPLQCWLCFDLANSCRSGPGGCLCAACTRVIPRLSRRAVFSSTLPAGTGLYLLCCSEFSEFIEKCSTAKSELRRHNQVPTVLRQHDVARGNGWRFLKFSDWLGLCNVFVGWIVHVRLYLS